MHERTTDTLKVHSDSSRLSFEAYSDQKVKGKVHVSYGFKVALVGLDCLFLGKFHLPPLRVGKWQCEVDSAYMVHRDRPRWPFGDPVVRMACSLPQVEAGAVQCPDVVDKGLHKA